MDAEVEGAGQTQGPETPPVPADNSAPPASTYDSATLESPGQSGPAFSAPPPDSFPGYQLVKEVHRGGQGVIYQAMQKSTKRRVAIKVMKEGPFAGKADQARFEREVQILGQMSHPNIVAIHDSGEAAGCHYFVMDYISGQPLDAWLAGRSASIEETLKLFAKICEAVNAAHLRGVIHRDLKPGNIRIDENGEPYVLDFGLAKTAASPAEASVMTMTGQFMGSLPWASPEQAEAIPSKIDIRTDVYALGVILYQMLTGKFPYDVIGNMRDVLDRIMKAEPVRPSAAGAAAGHCVGRIDDELDTIVLKCLSKERERRYQSAGELARDVRRYLCGEPIEAKRDSALYVLRKQLKKYKLPAGMAAAFVVLVTTGFVTSLTLWRQAAVAEQQEARQRQRAELERSTAIAAQQMEAQQRNEAERQRAAAQWRTYVANILAADMSLRAHEVTEAKRRLAACEPNLRGWEWHYLQGSLDNSIGMIETHLSLDVFLTFSQDGKHVLVRDALDLGKWNAEPAGTAADPPIGVPLGGPLIILGANQDQTRLVVGRLSGTPAGRSVFFPTSAVARGTLRVVEGPTGRAVADLVGHTNFVTCAVFSPDGTRVASACAGPPPGSPVDNTIRIWDAETGENVFTFDGLEGPPTAVAFNHDGTRLASCGIDAHRRAVYLHVWDVESGTLFFTRATGSGPISCVGFSPDGQTLAAGSFDSSVSVFDLASDQPPRTLQGHEGVVVALGFSPDGSLLATGGADKTVRLWSVQGGYLRATLRGHEQCVTSVAFRPDGRMLVSGSRDGTLRLWDPSARGGLLNETNVPARTCFAWSPDGRTLVVALDDRSLLGLDASTGARMIVMRGHTSWITSLAYSSLGKFVVSGSRDGTVRVWDADTGAEARRIDAHPGGVASVEVSPDGTQIASAGDDGVLLWDWASGTLLSRLSDKKARAATFRRDGSPILAVLGEHGQGVELVARDSTERGRLLPINTAISRCLAISPDGGRIVAGIEGNVLRMWDASSGDVLETLSGHDDRVNDQCFSPDGARIASASLDGTVRVWDGATLDLLLTLPAQGGPAYVAFSPDGKRLAALMDGRGIQVWDIRSAPNAEGAGARKETLLPPQAVALVDALFAEHPLGADVVDLLRADASLTPEVRAAAVRLVETCGRSCADLNNDAWQVVRSPNSDSAAYAEALRHMESVCRHQPDEATFLNTLGVAQYRAGQYQNAVATLRGTDEINRSRPAGASPADVAFLAMALQQLGRTDEARVELERLRQIMQQQKWAHYEDGREFLREAEMLIDPGAQW